MGKKVCLFVGNHRPFTDRKDSGEELLKALLSPEINLTAVYVPPNDPLVKKKYRACEVRTIPEIMCQPKKQMLENFQKKEFFTEWIAWLDDFRREKYSLGVVYFGGWIPPDLFTAPELGFLNFHPGPLPALRGFEAETWAILSDMCSFYGTVHKVSAEYDEGEIIWRTPQVPIRPRETPHSLLLRACYAGISNIHEIVCAFHDGKMESYPQKITAGIVASTKLVASRAKVNWAEDSLAVLDRKNRAFNGQSISVPFTLVHEEEERIISNIHTLPGEQGGGLGEYLGKYTESGAFRGGEMFQALDGIVVTKLLPPGTKKPGSASVFAAYNDFS